jgi:hypothetical protein
MVESISCLGPLLDPSSSIYYPPKQRKGQGLILNPYAIMSIIKHISYTDCRTRGGKMQRIYIFLGGALLGWLIGFGIAVLLAPASGEELREQMQARAKQVELEVKNAAASRRAELEQQLAELRTPKK